MLPLLLGTAIAAILLIILHFFGLRLRQKLEFSHIQFLTALISKTQSVRRINNYLLLFLRLLFISSALSAFLLYLFNRNTLASTSIGKAAILLDTSWSMQSYSAEKGRSKAQMAQDAIESIQEEEAQGQLAKQNNNSSTITNISIKSKANFLSSLNLIEGVERESRLTKTYIFSDFQKEAFSIELLKSLPKEQAVTLVSLSHAQAPNLYIDSVWVEQPNLMPGTLSAISVRVAGSLMKNNSQVKITASEGGKLVGATQVLLEPAQKAIAHFKVPLTRDQSRKITFTVDDPETPFDNAYFIVLPKPSTVNIKVNRPGGPRDPIVQAYKAEPAFTFSNTAAGASDLWILDIPANGGSSALASEIKAWAERGGSVLLIPNSNTQEATVSFLASIGLRGVSEESKEVGAKSLKQPDLSDAFFGQIFEKEVRNMKMPEAQPVLRWQSAFHTILKFTDNAPFLSTFRVGQGNVHLFSAPITNASAFVAHPLFVPVLYQLALSSTSAKIVLAHQPVNQSIVIPVENQVESKQPYALTREGQTFIPDQKVRQNQLMMTLPENVGSPGFYDLQREGKVITQIALNIPRVESKLEAYTTDELKEIMAEYGDAVQVIAPEERVSVQKQLEKETSGSSPWKYCLILCFLCLAAEAVILNTKKSGSLI